MAASEETKSSAAEEAKAPTKWEAFKAKAKSFAASAWLRMQLLWIWLIKNVGVFLQLILWTLILICLFDPRIDENTPFFGSVFLPIIMIRSDAAAQESSAGVWLDVIITALSTGVSAYCVIYKTRQIALNDIKSKNLKIALIKAGMYFDESGKLCKRVETATKLDINGDGKVGDTDVKDIPAEGVIKGSVRAGKELVTILTADLDPDKDGKPTADEAIEKAGLEETIDAIGDEASAKTEATAADASAAASTTEAEKDNTKKTSKMAASIKSLNSKISDWWKGVCKSISESKNPKLGKASEETKASEASASSEKAETASAKRVEIIKTTEAKAAAKPAEAKKEAKAETAKAEEPKAAPAKKAIPANDKNIDDILAGMR